jgi:hypothetical protein
MSSLHSSLASLASLDYILSNLINSLKPPVITQLGAVCHVAYGQHIRYSRGGGREPDT